MILVSLTLFLSFFPLILSGNCTLWKLAFIRAAFLKRTNRHLLDMQTLKTRHSIVHILIALQNEEGNAQVVRRGLGCCKTESVYLWVFRDNCGPVLIQVQGCFPSSEGRLIPFYKAPLKGQARKVDILGFVGIYIFRQATGIWQGYLRWAVLS